MRLGRALFRKTPWSVAAVLILSVSAFAIVVAPYVPIAREQTAPPTLTTMFSPVNCVVSIPCSVTDTATLSGTGHDATGTMSWYDTPTNQCPNSAAQKYGSSAAPDPGAYTFTANFNFAAAGTYYFYAQWTTTSVTGGTVVVVTSPCEELIVQSTRTTTSSTSSTSSTSGSTTPCPFPLTTSGACPALSVFKVKFVCNQSPPAKSSAVIALGLEPGFYDTDINIHNPSFLNTNVTLVEKFIVAVGQSQDIKYSPPNILVVPAVPTPYVIRAVTLEPDAAVRISCGPILAYLRTNSALASENTCGVPLTSAVTGTPPVFKGLSTCKGFVMIYTDISPTAANNLDVWAEYSVAGTSSSGVTSFDVKVQIQPTAYVP